MKPYKYVCIRCGDSMLSGVLLSAAVLSVISLPAWGSLVAKSTISECIAHSGTEMKDKIDASCNKKLVVAMTVSANEVDIYV